MSGATLPEDDELLAAELAFGLLAGEEQRAAQIRLAGDTDFAAAYARWQDYAAAMFHDAGQAPRPSVWSVIEARLPANDMGRAMVPRATLRWWQGGAAAACVAALALGVLAMRQPTQVFVRVPVAQAPTAPMVAVLTGKQGLVTVSFDPASGRMTSAANGLVLGDHVPELWVIPADGKPRSMGVVHAAGPSWGKVPAPAIRALSAGVTLAVSIEPVGGSPSGLPTGPVILTGKMAAAA